MSTVLVSDDLWAIIAPLLPPEPPKPKGGRPRLDDRQVLTGIISVLKSGIGWELLPSEMGCGSGMTCWRRLRDWNRAGVWERQHRELLQRLWERQHRELLQRLADADKIDWSRASLDSARVPAKRRGAATGPNPTDRGEPGSKRHLVVERCGVPLAIVLSAANLHDSLLLEAALDAIPPIHQPRRSRGRPRHRPLKLHADKGYDYPRCRQARRRRGIIPRIARRGVESSEGLGRHRWVVERTLA